MLSGRKGLKLYYEHSVSVTLQYWQFSVGLFVSPGAPTITLNEYVSICFLIEKHDEDSEAMQFDTDQATSFSENATESEFNAIGGLEEMLAVALKHRITE